MKLHPSIVLCTLLLGACAHTQQATAPLPADMTQPAKPSSKTQAVSLVSQLAPVANMQQAADRVESLLAGSRTLVVFDIDDTLLTTPRTHDGGHVFFGSDRWYLWQDAKPNLSPDKASGPEVVPCLFDVIAMNYELGLQEATEPQAPAIIAALPFDRMVLTSRSADYREATERQLAVAGYPVPVFPSLGTVPGGFGYKSDVNGALVTYANGILMTKGGNKGKMLNELLARPEMKLSYDNVVLVDDSQDKLENMQEALAGTGVFFLGLRYEGVKPYPLAPVSAAEKHQAAASWNAWKHFLQQQYPQRWEQMADRDGACKAKPAQR